MATPEELARLAAGAQAGASGIAAYEEAQKTVSASRDQALAGLQSEVSAIGGGADVMASLRGTIERPVQRVLDSLAAGQAFHTSDLARMDAGTQNYLSQASAAVPLMKAEVEREYAGEFARAKALAEAAAAGGGGGGGGDWNELSDTALRTMGLGAAQNARDLRSQEQFTAQSRLEDRASNLVRPYSGAQRAVAAARERAGRRPNFFERAAASFVVRAGENDRARRPNRSAGRQYVQARREAEQRMKTVGGDPTLPGSGERIKKARADVLADLRKQFSYENVPNARRQRDAARTLRIPKKLRALDAADRMLTRGQEGIVGGVDRTRAARQKVLDDLASGIGLSTDVQEQLIAQGVDETRARGVFDATEERTYVNAQRQLLGMPSLDEQAEAANAGPQVANVLRSPMDAGKIVGATSKQVEKRLGFTHFDPGNEAALKAMDDEGLTADEVAEDPRFQTSIVNDIILSANDAVGEGITLEQFSADVQRAFPSLATKPKTLELALAMIEPLFAYRASQTRDLSSSYGGG